LDNVVTMLADEPVADGGIEKHIGSEGGAKEPGGDNVANAVSLAFKLCHFGGGYRPLYVEQQDADVGFVAHFGATPKIKRPNSRNEMVGECGSSAQRSRLSFGECFAIVQGAE
jgi:hypothetical protein